MRQTSKEAAKAKLETLCARWAALGPEDAAVKQNLQGEIFELVYSLFPGHEDGIADVFVHNWKNFDPAKGSAYGFFSSRVRLREKDAYRAGKGYQARIAEDTIQPGSGEDISLLEELPAGPKDDPAGGIQFDETACELIAAMLELPRRLRGQANNPTRHNYFRLFFTDGVATYLHRAPSPEGFQKRERELFAALKLEFLDYFMAGLCRTAADICCCPLKPHGELVEGQDMEETKLPLPGDVYVSYLDRVEHTKAGPSAVSRQRAAYEAEVRKWLF